MLLIIFYGVVILGVLATIFICISEELDRRRLIAANDISGYYSEMVFKPRIVMAIVGVGIPAPELQPDFVQNLQESLTCSIDNIEGDNVPHFDEFKLSEHGYITVPCVEELSKEWLISEVEKISPFEGINLTVMEEKFAPELIEMYAYLPGVYTKNYANILRRIKKSTPNLNTEYWKVRSIRVVFGHEEDGEKGTFLKLAIDEGSNKFLLKSCWRAHAGMSTVYFDKYFRYHEFEWPELQRTQVAKRPQLL